MAGVYIAVSNLQTSNKIKSILQQNGYAVIGQSQDAPNSIRQINTLLPELIILGSDLKGVNFWQLLGALAETKTPIVLLLKEWQQSMIKHAQHYNVFAFVGEPVSLLNLLPAVSTALANAERLRHLNAEIGRLKNDLAARKTVEKAKGLLTQHYNLTEDQAYKYLRKYAMDHSKTMQQVAQAILLKLNQH
ncbi:ANTAR domain-containing protein [Bacillota bacterium LX-D]|nr:ANTAR domain-containing protein [Bacillota bacterium LX-D]